MNIKQRVKLARRRLATVIDLDSDPVIEYTAVKTSTALNELNDVVTMYEDKLDKLYKQIKVLSERQK